MDRSETNLRRPGAEEAKLIGSIPIWRRKFNARLDFEVMRAPAFPAIKRNHNRS